MTLFPYSYDGYFYAMGSAFFGGSWQPITKSSKLASLHPAAKALYFTGGHPSPNQTNSTPPPPRTAHRAPRTAHRRPTTTFCARALVHCPCTPATSDIPDPDPDPSRRTPPHPAGLFCVAWLYVILDQDLYVFTAWGLASGALLVFTTALNVTVVIPAFGVAKSAAIVSGTALVTAVGWNYVLGSQMRSQLGTWAGVAIVIVAMNGLIFGKEEVTERSVETANAGLRRVSSKHSMGVDDEAPLVVTASEATAGGVSSRVDTAASTPSVTSAGRGGAGFTSAHLCGMTLICGVMAGSMLIPMDYADEEFHGIVYIPSMAIGAMLTVVPVSLGQFWIEGKSSFAAISKEIRLDAAPHGMLTGALFGVASGCNIKAIDALDYATAMVLMQTQILVSGAWGIALYNELKGKEVVYFFMWGSVLVVGALVASYYGTT